MSPQTQVEAVVQAFKTTLDERMQKYTADMTRLYQGHHSTQLAELSTEFHRMFSELSQKVERQNEILEKALSVHNEVSTLTGRRLDTLEHTVDVLEQQVAALKDLIATRDLRLTTLSQTQHTLVTVVKELVAHSGNRDLVRRVSALELRLKDEASKGVSIKGVDVSAGLVTKAAAHLPWFFAGVAVISILVACLIIWVVVQKYLHI